MTNNIAKVHRSDPLLPNIQAKLPRATLKLENTTTPVFSIFDAPQHGETAKDSVMRSYNTNRENVQPPLRETRQPLMGPPEPTAGDSK